MEGLIEVSTAVGRILVGAILVIAGVAKIRHGAAAFQKAILGYELVSRRAARLLATALPRVEIVVGAMLVAGVFIGSAATAAFVLILVFSIAIALSLLRGKTHRCGCLGFTSDTVQRVQWRLVYRNLCMLALLVAASNVSPSLTFSSDALLVLAAQLPQAPPWVLKWALASAALGAVIAQVYSKSKREALIADTALLRR